MARFTLPFTATRIQASTYLFGVALFSISFLVFLNSTISFVITDRIGQKDRVGDAVGTLGFADELVVVVACPLWGVLSDRIGLRVVAVVGYIIVGVALFVFVQAKNVYPQLLLGRLLFALGAAATYVFSSAFPCFTKRCDSSTMVTAILPTMTYKSPTLLLSNHSPSRAIIHSPHAVTPSISSELTITPTRYQIRSTRSQPANEPDPEASTSQLSGLVGMFTGLGALLALGFFLPLPTKFQKVGVPPSEAVADSFYVVGAIALLVAVTCFFGLRDLPSEQYKSWRKLFATDTPKENGISGSLPLPSYPQLLLRSLSLGMRDINIGLGYVGGFVARASSVAISLFIPLFVNEYFISSGRCPANPDESLQNPGEIKRNCQRAYIVASMLTGVSQVVALICAPMFGYLSANYSRYKLPLLLAAAAGVGGYISFGRLKSPDPTSEDGNIGAYFIVSLLGISQIGAIVSSLDLISRGIQTEDEDQAPIEDANGHATPPLDQNGTLSPAARPTSANSRPVLEYQPWSHHSSVETMPLMPSHLRRIRTSQSRGPLKGSIAGIYSLCGGAGILMLTKIGGLLFDRVDVGVPFYMMAVFNAVLFVITLVSVSWGELKTSESGRDEIIVHGTATGEQPGQETERLLP